MINEVVRLVSDWLADPDHGLNAVLATLPVDAGDTAPSGVVILNSTNSDDVAVGRPASVTRGVSVAMAGIKGLEAVSMQGAHRSGVVAVLVRWEGGGAHAAQVAQDAGYGIRAALLCLQQFWALAADAQRMRNGVQMLVPHAMGMEVTALEPRVQTEPMMAGILMPCEVIDTLT